MTLSFALLIYIFSSGTSYGDISKEYLLDRPTISTSKRGDIAGNLQDAVNSSGLSRGTFSVPVNIDFPQTRGPLLVNLSPTYAPGNGLETMGLGFKISLSVRRFREIGFPQYDEKDQMLTPFGVMVSGDNQAWYLKGLSESLKGEIKNNSFIIKNAAGESYFFSDLVLNEKNEVFEYYLSKVENRIGDRVELKYTKNESGQLFLSEVFYGGRFHFPQHKAEFKYKLLKNSFIDFRSGTQKVLDQGVSKINLYTLDNKRGDFKLNYSYVLKYTNPSLSVASFLNEITKIFPDGSSDPPQSFKFNYLDFDNINWVAVPKFDPLVEDYGPSVFSPKFSVKVDMNSDGVTDLELNHDYSSVIMNGASYNIETLPPPHEQTKSVCRSRYEEIKSPRLFSRIYGPKGELKVVDIKRENINTSYISVCDLDGTLNEEISIEGSWDGDEGVKLIDLNNDQLPDLIKISSNIYEIYKNESTENKLKFTKVGRFFLSENRGNFGQWLYDLNGDGIQDIVSCFSNNLKVFYGQPGFRFSDTPKKLRLYKENDFFKGDLDRYSLNFSDMNRDGVADLILHNSQHAFVFINMIDYLQMAENQIFKDFRRYSSKSLSVFDSLENGQPQITGVFGQKNTFSLELAKVGTSLLSEVDDHKGNRLTFKYEKSKVEKNFPQRMTNLKSFNLESMGHDDVQTDFSYSKAQMSSDKSRFLSFEELNMNSLSLSEKNTYFSNDIVSGVLKRKMTTDSLMPTISKVSEREFEKFEVNSVVGYRKKSSSNYIQGSNNQQANRVEEHFLYQGSPFCPSAKTTNKNQLGILNTVYSYFEPDHLEFQDSCLPKNVTLTGTHFVDASFDFNYQQSIHRNILGQVEKVEIGDKFLQGITYDANNRILEIKSYDQPAEIYSYFDNGLLKSISSSTGVIKEVSNYQEITDYILSVDTQRGENRIYSESFNFDSLGRLAGSWTNIDGGSAQDKTIEYSYHYGTQKTLGHIQTKSIIRGHENDMISTLESSEVFTSKGTPVGVIDQSASGLHLKQLTSFSEKNREEYHYSDKNIDSLDEIINNHSAFIASSTPVSFTATTSDSKTIRSTKVEEENVLHQTHNTYGIENSLILAKNTINMDNSLASHRYYGHDDLEVKFVNQKGDTYNYSYDLLGRLRQLIFPDKSIHSISYNQYGERAKNFRPGEFGIDYLYTKGLLTNKIYTDKSSQVVRKINQSFDEDGRMVTRSYLSPNATVEYKYFYDGIKCSLNSENSCSNSVGQNGFLSSIVGKDYAKNFSYRVDGKILTETTSIKNYADIIKSHTYRNDGEVSSIAIEERTSQGSFRNVLIQYSFDELGRKSALSINGEKALHFKYDHLNRISEIIYENSNDLNSFGFDKATNKLNKWNFSSDGKNLFAEKWNYNNRGLIESEVFSIDGQLSERSYQYNSLGFLDLFSEKNQNTTYSYGQDGLILNSTPAHGFDSFGRTVKNAGLTYKYGAHGRITQVFRNTELLAEYCYDEDEKILCKKKNGKIIEAYFDWGISTTNFGPLIKIEAMGRLIGFASTDGFIQINTDKRGSHISSIEMHSPYGALLKRDEKLMSVLDFAQGGYDADLLAVRFKNRFYDPILKKFLTPDSFFLENPEKCIGSPVECNLYSYAKNSPLNFVDPSGLNSIFLGGAGTEYETGLYSNSIVNKMQSVGIAEPRFIQNSTFLSKAGNLAASLAMRESPLHQNSSIFNSFLNPIINASNSNGGQRNIIGYSYGSVTGAQAALRMANSGTQIDNLVLIGSPISSSSELYKSLLGNSNIGNVSRIDIPNDPFSNGININSLFDGGLFNVPANVKRHFYYDNNSSGQQDALIRGMRF